MTPTAYKPTTAADFIGPANKVAHLMATKVPRLKEAGGFFAAIFHGPPGTGKSALCGAVASWLTSHAIAVETINGQSVTVDKVREWKDSLRMTSMFSDWRAIVIEEVDSASKQAMTQMLTLFDDKPKNVAFLMTTNTDPEKDLPERLQTRAFLYPVGKPKHLEVVALVSTMMGESEPSITAGKIGEVANGNVRAALIEAEAALDRKAVKYE
jgi:putative ATPase